MLISSRWNIRKAEPSGTVYIANDLTDVFDPKTGKVVIRKFEVQKRAYVHELGNLLSRKISASADGEGDPFTFGSEGIRGTITNKPDTDAGAALEKCVFGDITP